EFVGHFFMFLILTGLLIAVLQRVLSAVVIAFLFGIVTELVQPFFSRGAEGIDLLANTVGIISCVILYGVLKIGFEMNREKEPELEKRDAARRRLGWGQGTRPSVPGQYVLPASWSCVFAFKFHRASIYNMRAFFGERLSAVGAARWSYFSRGTTLAYAHLLPITI